MTRITLTLTAEERAALLALARQERRDPRFQAAIEIRQALERAGYLQPRDPGCAPALAAA